MDFVSRMPERFYWMYLYKTHQNLVKCSVNLLTVCITLFLLRIGLVPRFLWSPTHQRSSPPHHRVRLVNVSGKAANGCGRYIIQGSTCRFIFDNSRGQSYPKEFGGDWFWNHEKYDWWLMFSSSKSYPDQKIGCHINHPNGAAEHATAWWTRRNKITSPGLRRKWPTQKRWGQWEVKSLLQVLHRNISKMAYIIWY